MLKLMEKVFDNWVVLSYNESYLIRRDEMKLVEWLQIVVLGLGMSVVFAGWLLGY
jgi:hypothetical protein